MSSLDASGSPEGVARWYAMLLTGIALISTSAILITVAGVSPTTSAFYRNFFAAAAWLLILIVARPAALLLPSGSVEQPDHPAVGKLFRLLGSASARLLLFLLGLFFALDLWAWHRSIFYIGAGPATLMGNLQVLIVSVIAVYVFGERLKKWYWTGCLIALSGIGLLTLTGGVGERVALGIALGFGTAFSYAFFIVVIKFLARYGPPAEQTLFWVSSVSAVCLGVFVILEGKTFLLPSRTAFGWLLLHAVISSVLGWWFIVRALNHLPVAISATLLLLQPVLTSIWGHLFIGQHLSLLQAAGVVIAVSGIRIATWEALDSGRKKEPMAGPARGYRSH